MTKKPLEGRVALVTGASRGIGYALSLSLAEAGAHVIATARTQGGLEELDDAIREAGGSCTLVPLDLASPDGIEKLAAIVTERWSKLDILIANAGVLGKLTPASQLSAQTWNEVFAINVIAPARLIRAFEPLLLKSDAGRAVFMTSGAARGRKAFWAAYASSKAALDALVESWANEHLGSRLNINLVNPGPMRTAMRAKAFPGEDPETLPAPEDLAPLVLELVTPESTMHGKTVDFPDWKKS
ncbi:SDR family NAD(P)-dependent oxidoreductase [Hyphobacterium marinum]|uniref:SDR family NAD(P)-dependent oxidoreductase n=1 Tax=Hyphobacterium marinum TaxID=3116574 RepID=A0ABU7M028_9PROT|nr:SDR family NAD(P)-dependent oxidoreductase [Hyphobacterium sp. Y6023]MEE2567169.1 SDR family NAD(P)-dependent oxidoreductase [Hyphobacterium sp. Y6023]